MTNPARPPKVFISYAWEDDVKIWVRAFAKRLRKDGIETVLDQWETDYGDQLPEFMEKAVRASDFVILICTPKYKKKSDERQGGVGYEGHIITAEIFEKNNHRKFIPVLRKGSRIFALPSWAVGKLYIDLSGNPYSENNYRNLIRTLHGKKFMPPPVGGPPDFPDDDDSPDEPKPFASFFATLKETVSKSFTTLKSTVPKAMPFFRIISIIGIITIFFWFSSWAIPTLFLLETTPTPNRTLTSIVQQTDQALTSLASIPTAVRTLTPAPTSSPTKIIDSKGMVLVPAGEFVMGSDEGDIALVLITCERCEQEWFMNETPKHTVYINAYWMDKYEVTNTQYMKCVDAGKCPLPSDNKSSSRSSYYGNRSYNDYPVISVSWNNAKTFCEWADKRLPTEAEWEKAARDTDGRVYPWGNTFDASKLNWGQTIGDTRAVGSYLSGASFYGIMDLAGNVWEWVADWYKEDYYASSLINNPTGPLSGLNHIARGGSWVDGADNVRGAIRGWAINGSINDIGSNIIGFRCARDGNP